MAKLQRVRDPVHDLIEFDGEEFEQVCWRVVQTPQFQRMRRVKQLGFSDFVYPGAVHSRFAHSLGVFHTARKLAAVMSTQLGDPFDVRGAQQAIAAALVHDIGHGPFSHAFEDVLKKMKLGRHEDKSVSIIEDTEVGEALNSFTPGFGSKVAEIIGSESPKDIYAAIVTSQFDADRLDYMRRDRMMTGTQSSAIDFEWLLANLEVKRVPLDQDGEKVAEVETLVVGQKAVLAAEAYVVGLFQLYPTIYFHKATRSAEKIFSALLMRVFELVIDGRVDDVGLPKSHPIAKFAKAPEDLTVFQLLDDTVVWGAMPLLAIAKDECTRELAARLMNRKLFKARDVSAELEAMYPKVIGDEDAVAEKRREKEAEIRVRLKESGLLLSGESTPLVLEDQVKRDPYKRHSGGSSAQKMIHAIDRSGELTDLSSLSDVVGSLNSFSAYRLYFNPDDADVSAKLDEIVRG